MNLRRVAQILNGPLVIVSQRGVEFTLPAKGWDAVSVAQVCAEIDRLPETSEPHR